MVPIRQHYRVLSKRITLVRSRCLKGRGGGGDEDDESPIENNWRDRNGLAGGGGGGGTDCYIVISE